jgi:hypothetical protein
MSNITPVDGAQATPEASLSDLAKIIRSGVAAIEQVVDTVSQTINSALPRVLDVGHAAIAAKQLVPKGEWGLWVRRHCNTSERHIRRCIAVTEAYEASGHAVSADFAGLSFRGLMRKLTPPKKQGGTAKGVQRRKSSTAGQDRLNSLLWTNASPIERASFVSAVGWQAIVEVIPVDWRPAIEAWLHPKPAPAVIDPDGYPIPEDLSIPGFLKVVSPDGVTIRAEVAMTAAPATLLISVIHEGRCLGFLLHRGPLGVEVFTRETQSLGCFPTEHEAIGALLNPTKGEAV